ncbi:hypothetical protein MMC25_001108 [Agyrium rufum]|nr:hypothetical protein [Agyrium rufum]
MTRTKGTKSDQVVIIAGVGHNLGASIARRFARTYTVFLLSRHIDSFGAVVNEINAAGGKAFGVVADVSDEESVKKVFEEISKRVGKNGVAAAIFNLSGGYVIKPFLELSVADIDASNQSNGRAAFIFSQAVIPLLVSTAETSNASSSSVTSSSGGFAPTLLFTGASASVRGSACFAAFSSGKFAVRSLSQSLAREFGPKGVHVAHAIIDGAIGGPGRRKSGADIDLATMIEPDAIAETYFGLHAQDKSAFTYEVDIRPFNGNW